MLDGEAPQNEGPVPFRSAIALVVRLASACNQVPASLRIKNVDILRWSPVDGGGSSDIYCGKYRDTAVAIKRLRSHAASPTDKVRTTYRRSRQLVSRLTRGVLDDLSRSYAMA